MAIYQGAYSGPEIDRLLAKADSSDVFSEERLNGLSFEQITKEDFDDLTEKDNDKVYFVYDNRGKVKQFIGEAELSGIPFAAGDLTAVLNNHVSMLTGTIEEE